jgi:hypothetical protein
MAEASLSYINAEFSVHYHLHHVCKILSTWSLTG